MCKVVTTGFLILFIFINSIYSKNSFVISELSRPIQVDALLMEWNSQYCKTFNNRVADAGLTPDYLTGYVRFNFPDSTTELSVGFVSLNSKYEKYYNIDTSFQFIEVALEIENIDENIKTAVMEWQLPISDLGSDSLGNVGLFLLLKSDDSLAIDTIEIKGSVLKGDNGKGNNLIIQIILISLLLIIFIYMKSKVRKKFST